MPATRRNFAIDQGATWRWQFSWHDDGPIGANGLPTAGAPRNLTGCKARMQLRTGYGKAVLAEASTDNGRITIDGPAGLVRVHFSDEDTDALNVQKALYDLEIEYPSGDVLRVLQGEITIDPNITREATP